MRDDNIFNNNRYNQEQSTKKDKSNINKENEDKKDIDNNYTGRNSFFQDNENDDYIISSRKKSIESESNPLYSNIDLNKFLYSENIIYFNPYFSEDKNIYNNIESNRKNNNINLRSQYYLYIASLLEELMNKKEKVEEFIEKIKNKKNLKELNIKKLILLFFLLFIFEKQ